MPQIMRFQPPPVVMQQPRQGGYVGMDLGGGGDQDMALMLAILQLMQSERESALRYGLDKRLVDIQEKQADLAHKELLRGRLHEELNRPFMDRVDKQIVRDLDRIEQGNQSRTLQGEASLKPNLKVLRDSIARWRQDSRQAGVVADRLNKALAKVRQEAEKEGACPFRLFGVANSFQRMLVEADAAAVEMGDQGIADLVKTVGRNARDFLEKYGGEGRLRFESDYQRRLVRRADAFRSEVLGTAQDVLSGIDVGKGSLPILLSEGRKKVYGKLRGTKTGLEDVELPPMESVLFGVERGAGGVPPLHKRAAGAAGERWERIKETFIGKPDYPASGMSFEEQYLGEESPVWTEPPEWMMPPLTMERSPVPAMVFSPGVVEVPPLPARPTMMDELPLLSPFMQEVEGPPLDLMGPLAPNETIEIMNMLMRGKRP